MLRTGVTVACRIRPAPPPATAKPDVGPCINVVDACTVNYVGSGGYLTLMPSLFTFHSVFSPDSSNDTVFQQVVRPVIEDVVSGYHGSVLAYGQTGSGKTHTITGILPLIAQKLFSLLEADAAWSYSVTVSCVELYLERIWDLCDLCKSNLRLRERSDGSVYVEDATVVAVRSGEELAEVIFRSTANRSTAATAMNQVSSRSHALTIINVVKTHKAGGEVLESELVVADLAGSELISRTGASGLRLEEAKAILKSLSALTSVVIALAGDEETDTSGRPARPSSTASGRISSAFPMVAESVEDVIGVASEGSLQRSSSESAIRGRAASPLSAGAGSSSFADGIMDNLPDFDGGTGSSSEMTERRRMGHRPSMSDDVSAFSAQGKSPNRRSAARPRNVTPAKDVMTSLGVQSRERADSGRRTSLIQGTKGRSGDSPLKPTARHVPYRDSKLTRLLQKCLGGNAKTALVICASPAAEDGAETLSSLRFGVRAQKIRNMPVVNRQALLSPMLLAKELAEAKIQLAEQQSMIEKLKASLDAAQLGAATLSGSAVLPVPVASFDAVVCTGPTGGESNLTGLVFEAHIKSVEGDWLEHAEAPVLHTRGDEPLVIVTEAASAHSPTPASVDSDGDSNASVLSILSTDTYDIVADMLFDPEAAASWVRDLKRYARQLHRRTLMAEGRAAQYENATSAPNTKERISSDKS